MKYEKGQSGNSSGRPKGSKNIQLKDRLQPFIGRISKALVKASAQEKNEFFLDFTNLVLGPTQNDHRSTKSIDRRSLSERATQSHQNTVSHT